MKTYINGILISVLLLIFTFDFIGQTLIFNHVDIYPEEGDVIPTYDQNISMIINEEDSTINFLWEEFEVNFLYEIESIINEEKICIYNINRPGKILKVIHYIDKNIFDIVKYDRLSEKELTYNSSLNIYNDN
jgi:hypothetical protein